MPAFARARFQTYTRNVNLFLAIELLIGFTLDGGIFSVLFNLFLLRLGYGPQFIGVVNASGLLAFALFSLPAGIWGRRWGIKRMMAIGLWTMSSGGIFLPLAEVLASPWREGGLILGYVAIMTGLSFFFVNGTPFLMGSVASHERNRVFALQTALISLAGFVGSLVGGRLPALFAGLLGITTEYATAYRYPLLLAGLLMLPALLLILRAEDVDPRLSEKTKDHTGPAPLTAISAAPFMVLAMLVLVRIFQVSGVATTSTFFNVYLDTDLNVSTTQIGLLTAFGRLTAVAAALLFPLLARRWGTMNVVVIACTGTALSFLPLALGTQATAAGIGFIGVVGLSALRYPAFMVYAMDLISPEQRGTMAGAGEMAAGLIFAIIALGGGYWVSIFGFRTLFLIAALLSAIGAGLFWAYFRTLRKRQSLKQPVTAAS